MDYCPNRLLFPAVSGRTVVGEFDGGDITSDAGALLLARAEAASGIIGCMAEAVKDRRQAGKVRHPLRLLLKERVYSIALGYEDANDLDTLRHDPALLVSCGKLPTAKQSLASQPTVSRMENALSRKDLFRMGRAMAAGVIDRLPADTKEVILDFDATDDECHGQQELALFESHYGHVCYVPLYLHVTDQTGRKHLLAALLRSGYARTTKGTLGLLKRAVALLRARFEEIAITVRGDCVYGYGALMNWCDKHAVSYVCGYHAHPSMKERSFGTQMIAASWHKQKGDGHREYDETTHQAEGWHRERRILWKAEVNGHKVDCRFLVTSDEQSEAEAVYTFYSGRGDQENRIKEMKLDLDSGRTSCHRFLANQCRLLLHTAACQLMGVLQCLLSGTQYAKAQIGTLRLRLLKVGARVVQSCRAIRLHLASAYPDQSIWHILTERLLAMST